MFAGFSDRGGLYCYMMHAGSCGTTARVGQGLSHGLHQFITQFAHFRFLDALIAAAKAATDLRCSAVKSARSFLP